MDREDYTDLCLISMCVTPIIVFALIVVMS